MNRPMRDFALEVHFSRWEFAAKYNMAGSDAETLTIGELLDLASADDREAFQRLGLGYTETLGAPVLRGEIASMYETASPENVLCFAGAEEAIYVSMRTLLEAGDHAILITPNYQSAETVPLSQCEVTGVPLDSERGWELDVDRLSRAVRPNTKLISINFPHNPTGKVIARESLDAIVDLCRRRGIWLFSDEVYRGLERDQGARLPQAVDLYERAISLNVMSKAYGLAGLRIGWVVAKDHAFLTRCERYKQYLSICNAAPSEALALMALRARSAIVGRNRAIIADNLALLDEFFRPFQDLFDWRASDGGCIAFIRYKGKDGVEEFTRRLVEEAGVLLLPASVFRSELNPVPANCLRIGFGRTNLPEAVQATRNWLLRNFGPG